MTDRTYILVDGENLLTRYECMLKEGYTAYGNILHQENKYVWHPKIVHGQESPIARVSYYTTYVGDSNAIEELQKEISQLDYQYFSIGSTSQRFGKVNPHVFKKSRQGQGTKSVDINICVDALRHIGSEGLVTVLLITGDGDYLPLINELMRRGINVNVKALSSGCNPSLEHVPDSFTLLDPIFISHVPKKST